MCGQLCALVKNMIQENVTLSQCHGLVLSGYSVMFCGYECQALGFYIL